MDSENAAHAGAESISNLALDRLIKMIGGLVLEVGRLKGELRQLKAEVNQLKKEF